MGMAAYRQRTTRLSGALLVVPHLLIRRLVQFAAEDISMADSNALTQAPTEWENLRAARLAGRRTGDSAGGDPSRYRSEIERDLYRVQRGALRPRGRGR
jgi:hypothetical protein